MKRVVITIVVLAILLQLLPVISPETKSTCDLNVVLLNQDPYPAIPGESLKIVFQINGASNPDCGKIDINLLETYPFSLDPSYTPLSSFNSGTYVRNFPSFVLVPYQLIVAKDAIKGENKLELEVSPSSTGILKYTFNIEVSDLRTDFEVFVRDYDKKTNTLTFGILNTGENDVNALTIDIPKQEAVNIMGSSRKIIGSLDSNDDTTFSFEALPKTGDINLILTYTDGLNERRVLDKVVHLDMSYFEGRAGDKTSLSIWFYITLVLAIVIIFFWYRGMRADKRRMNRNRESNL